MPTKRKTIVKNDIFLHLPSTPQNSLPTVIFFITGNPGLIGYYHQFLTLLCQANLPAQNKENANANQNELSESSPLIGDECVVAGFSLGGFEVSSDKDLSNLNSKQTSLDVDIATNSETTDVQVVDELDINNLLYPAGFRRKEIYGLQDQIELCYARLTALTAGIRRRYSPDAKGRHSQTQTADLHDGRRIKSESENEVENVDVILMGHSVGAYIALEMIRTHHTAGQQHKSSPSTDTSTRETHIQITTTILLTPTIINIALSPSGRIATPLLTYLPFLPGLLQLGSSSLVSLLSRPRLRWLVARVTGMPDGPGLDATVAFLGRRGAVRQALFLAREEMWGIGAHGWGLEVWGVVNQGGDGEGDGDGDGEESVGGVEGGDWALWSAPRLYFWFAKEDHWVADATREEILKLVDEKFGVEGDSDDNGDGMGVEARIGNRPVVVVDRDEGLVHAWCITQSEIVARRVGLWLKEALRR